MRQDTKLASAIIDLTGADFRWIPLAGGQTNASFKLCGRGQSLALRLNRAPPLPGIDRGREQQLLQRLNGCAFAPQTLYFNDDPATAQGAWLYRFVEGTVATPQNLRATSTLQRVVNTLALVHQHNCGSMPAFDMRTHLEALEAGGVSSMPSLRAAARDALERLYRPGRALCHSDPLHSNLVLGADTAVLLDWEYAHVGDPLMDLAALAHYHDIDHELLLSLYPLAEPDAPERLPALRTLFAYLCSFWPSRHV